MDVLLETHGAKNVLNMPEGLPELCSDISREVLKNQPNDIYNFIADYTENLLIIRENTKVAVKVIDYVSKGSENLISILIKHGFSLNKIATVAPRLQAAFKEYLSCVDLPCDDFCPGNRDDQSELSIKSILKSCGISYDKANHAAEIIQKAFRKHYREMLFRESQGEVQWQRAVMRTIDVLKSIGASQKEIDESLSIIMSVYKGYYSKINQIKRRHKKDPSKVSAQAVAWLSSISEMSSFEVYVSESCENEESVEYTKF